MIFYIIPTGWPENGKLQIKALSAGNSPAKIKSITLLNYGEVRDFTPKAEGLVISLPAAAKPDLSYAYVLKVLFN